MPRQDRPRREEQQTLARGGRQGPELVHQHRQAQLLPAREPRRARLGALQDGQLAAEQEDLQVLITVDLAT